MSDMGKWKIRDVSADMTHTEPEYWEAVVELEHADDGRRLEVELVAEVHCDTTLDGDKIGQDGFLSDADLEDWVDYCVASGRFTEEDRARTLGREYWACFSGSTLTAIIPDGSAYYLGEREEILSGEINLDYSGEAFDSCGRMTDGLHDAIEHALKSAARSEVAYAEYWADEAYLELLESGEREAM